VYGLAYVIVPTEFASLQAALDESLVPFRRGGTGDFPRARNLPLTMSPISSGACNPS